MSAQELVSVLASKRRTILLGGMAMILHGLGRSTKDYDIWLDPLPDVEAWGKAIHELLEMVPGLQAQRIDPVVPGNWLAVGREALASVGLEDGLVRLAGGDRPIDVFFLPNELTISDFEGVWQRSTEIEHGVRLIDKIDLAVTKQLTERAIDRTDVAYLSERITEEYKNRLASCSEEEAKKMFERFATPEIAAFAYRESGDPGIQRLGWQTLDEMRAAGDPFAVELMEELKTGQPRSDHTERSQSEWRGPRPPAIPPPQHGGSQRDSRGLDL